MKRRIIYVLFGATGDLGKRYLLPSLYRVYREHLQDKEFSLIGFGRREWSDTAFRDFVKETLNNEGGEHVEGSKEGFLRAISYFRGEFSEVKDFEKLQKKITDLLSGSDNLADVILHLAVPPEYYSKLFRSIGDSKLNQISKRSVRILIEKPFGEDLTTARNLDVILKDFFAEEQTYRIDHYLAKEVLQNIIFFRFSNVLFEPIWNSDYIERIEIRFNETLGLEGRNAMYEKVGALRDIGQNHLLQMAASVIMERPASLKPEDLHKARANAIGLLHKLTPEEVKSNTIRAQYRGYREEHEGLLSSTTETYFRIKTSVQGGRLAGVPITLEGGKYLSEARKEVRIIFKEPRLCLCREEKEHASHRNELVFRIEPDQGIEIKYFAKRPGLRLDTEAHALSFSYKNSRSGHLLAGAYERLIFGAISGDRTLFAGTQEVLASWEFIMPILEGWQDLGVIDYEKGSLPLTDF